MDIVGSVNILLSTICVVGFLTSPNIEQSHLHQGMFLKIQEFFMPSI